MKSNNIFKLTVISIFSALSALLYYFVKFPLPFFPGFLDIQFSNVPVIIVFLLFGPLEATVVLLVKMLIKMPNSSTAYIGEIGDFLIGLSIVYSMFLISKIIKECKYKTIIVFITGSLFWVISAVILNYFLLIPFYLDFYFKGNIQGLLSFFSMIPNVNENNYMIKYTLYAAIPFNLLLSVIVFLISYLVYIRIKDLEIVQNNK